MSFICKNPSLFIFLSLFLFGLNGCEGDFAGKRPYDIVSLNNPYEMKIVRVGGTTYLALLNSDAKNIKRTGSLQFYSLTNPAAPVLVESLTVELPSNVGDFIIYGDSLYIAERNTAKILVYDYVSGVFSPRLSGGKGVSIQMPANPQRLGVFVRTGDGVSLLAVVCQSAGTIVFVRLDTLAYVTSPETTAETSDVRLTNGIRGAGFNLIPRQVEQANIDDPLYIGGGEALGGGINGIEYLGGTYQTIVTASFMNSAIFGYRFSTFENASNFAWNFQSARDGYTENSTVYPGTGQNGFRGLVSDAAHNVYATNRSNDRVIVMSRADFETDKSGVRNTRGYPIDGEGGKFIDVVFDDDLTDTTFPRLGDLVVNNSREDLEAGLVVDGTAATLAWVLGTGVSKVYRIDLSVPSVTHTSVQLGSLPQRILYYSAANRLYVANTISHSVSILDADDLSVLNTLQN